MEWQGICHGPFMQASSSIADKHTLCARTQFPQVWWVDPAGAILISAYIIFSWAVILRNQARLASAAACCPASLLLAACACDFWFCCVLA